MGHPRVRAHGHLARARRVPVGAPLRRLSRRSLRPRGHGRSSTSRTATGTARRSRSSRACRPRSRSSSRRPPGCSSRATGCGSRSPEPTGRTPGRRRAVRRFTSNARAWSSSFPSSTGQPPLPAPSFCRRRPERTPTRPQRTREQPPVVWRFEDDQLEHETRAVTSYGSNYEAPFGAHVEERYEGTVGVSIGRSGPGVGARDAPSTASTGPRRTCARRRDSRCARTPPRTTSSSSSWPRSSGLNPMLRRSTASDASSAASRATSPEAEPRSPVEARTPIPGTLGNPVQPVARDADTAWQAAKCADSDAAPPTAWSDGSSRVHRSSIPSRAVSPELTSGQRG